MSNVKIINSCAVKNFTVCQALSLHFQYKNIEKIQSPMVNLIILVNGSYISLLGSLVVWMNRNRGSKHAAVLFVQISVVLDRKSETSQADRVLLDLSL